MPQKETLDRAAYTCMLVSYRRLPPQFQFSLSGVTLVYCISMGCAFTATCSSALGKDDSDTARDGTLGHQFNKRLESLLLADF